MKVALENEFLGLFLLNKQGILLNKLPIFRFIAFMAEFIILVWLRINLFHIFIIQLELNHLL
jgi:hypothetical protein